MADGSIIIDTKIDTSAFEKGTKSIKSQAATLAAVYRKQGMSSSDSFKRAWSEIERTTKTGSAKAKNSIRGIGEQSNKTAQTIGGTLAGSLQKLFGVVSIAYLGTQILRFAKDSIKASTEIANAMTGLKSIVDGQGRSFKQANGFIQEYISDGLIPATDAVTAYKNLAMRGYTDTQIETTLQALKDSAAFGRQASLSLGQAVSSATEGLKNENSILVDNAGVTKNVSMMWKDYAASIGVGVNSLTKQQKIQAEVLGIMEETRFQTGDAAKVADTYSGSILRLQFNLNNMKIAFGNFLTPIISAVIPIINTAISVLTKFFNILAQVSALLFGKKVSSVGQKEQTNQVQQQEQAIGGAVQNEKELGKATKKTAKEADKLTSSLDEMNTIQKDTGSDSGSGGGGGGSSGAGSTAGVEITDTDGLTDFEPPQQIIDFVNNLKEALQPTIEAIKNLVKNLDPLKTFIAKGLEDFYNNFLKPVGSWILGEGLPGFINAITKMVKEIDWAKINTSLNGLWKALAPFAINVGKGLLWFWEKVLTPLGTWVMSDVVPVFLDILSASIEIFNGVITALKPLFLWLWDTFLQPITAWTGGVIVSVLNGIKLALQGVSDWITNNQSIVASCRVAIGAFFLAWKATELMAFIQMSGGIAAAITTITTAIKAGTLAKLTDKAQTIALTAMYSKDFIVSLVQGTAALVTQAAQWVVNTALKVADTVAQWGMIAATTAWNAICVVASAVTAAFGAAVAFLTSPIGIVILAITAIIAVVVLLIKNWDTVKEVAVKCWEGIKVAWQVVATWFNTNVIQPVVEFFKNMWDGIKKLASDTWTGIKNIWNAVSTWFKTNIITPVTTAFTTLWTGIKTLATTCWEGIVLTWTTVSTWFTDNIIDPVTTAFDTFWTGISGFADTAWKAIKKAFTAVSTWFTTNVGEPIAKVFMGAWNGVMTGVVSVVNFVITTLNAMIKGALAPLNLLIDGLNLIPGVKITKLAFEIPSLVLPSAPKLTLPTIPALARGAVLPANKPFYAQLGDQKHGRNLEAPEDLIRQIVREESTDNTEILELLRQIRDKDTTVEIDGNVVGTTADNWKRNRGANINKGVYANAY